MKQRTGSEPEFALLLVVEVDTGQIRRLKIRRELHTTEAAADGARESAQEHGLACAWNIFQKHMSAAHKTDDHLLDLFPLSHYGKGYGGYDLIPIIGKPSHVHE